MGIRSELRKCKSQPPCQRPLKLSMHSSTSLIFIAHFNLQYFHFYQFRRDNYSKIEFFVSTSLGLHPYNKFSLHSALRTITFIKVCLITTVKGLKIIFVVKKWSDGNSGHLYLETHSPQKYAL